MQRTRYPERRRTVRLPLQIPVKVRCRLPECHVTSLREKRERRFVGITFTSPNTDFWHIVFPKAGTRQAVRSPQTGALVPPGFRQDDQF